MDVPVKNRSSLRHWLIILAGCLVLNIGLAWLTPPEKTLGIAIRLIYLHGAWVWTGIIAFTCAALAGLAALIFRSLKAHTLSRALGWTGIVFWLTYLPMSMAVMQINWNGFFFDEPRWQVPFTFAVIGVLLQAGLLVINLNWLTSLANSIFGPALLFNLMQMESILHPESPVADSGSGRIKLMFILILASTLITGGVLTVIWQFVFPANRTVQTGKG